MTFVNLAGRVLGGRYELDRHLADGGMGAVWTANDLTLRVPVAVKLMSVEGAMRANLRARFEQEAKAVALLRSPHIVQVLDYGTDGDTPFIVLELLEGINLLATQEHAGSWPLPEVAALVVQVAQGLGTAHRAGLIHRDVKPSNIFLARVDAGDEVLAKVIDFGIAAVAENEEILTAANVALYSPSYIEPGANPRAAPRCSCRRLGAGGGRVHPGDGRPAFVGRNGPAIAREVVLGNRRKDTTRASRTRRASSASSPARSPRSRRALPNGRGARGEFVLVAGVPSALRTAARAVAAARGSPATSGKRRRGRPPMFRARPRGSATRPSRTTCCARRPEWRWAERAPRRQGPEAEDLEETVAEVDVEDDVSPSGAAAGRNGSSE